MIADGLFIVKKNQKWTYYAKQKISSKYNHAYIAKHTIHKLKLDCI